MKMSLEVVYVPVSDVDRAKEFYEKKLGFKVDMDVEPSKGERLVQLTPDGSGCSIHIGSGQYDMKPGSLKGLILVVESAEQLKQKLEAKGVNCGEVEELPWGKHVAVQDPDGNGWTLQEMYSRKNNL